jgi:hypothetical protein
MKAFAFVQPRICLDFDGEVYKYQVDFENQILAVDPVIGIEETFTLAATAIAKAVEQYFLKLGEELGEMSNDSHHI